VNLPDWNERTLSEDPAVELLRLLGYAFVDATTLNAERDSQRSALLPARIAAAVRRINPWLSADNVPKAVRVITSTMGGLLEVNEALHTVLTLGVALPQEIDGRTANRTVKLIDYDDWKNNEFLVTRQYRVIKDSSVGADDTERDGLAIFDVVAFVNGMPLAVIECKSPLLKSKDPIAAAVAQLERYQESAKQFQGRGVPQAFGTVQVLIAACQQRASFGSIAAPLEYYAPFPETYPLGVDWLEGLLNRTPTAQDVLIYSVLEPQNLLEMVRSYVVFEVEDGRTFKKLARHQQRIAVDLTVRRVLGTEDQVSEQRVLGYQASRVGAARWRLESDAPGGVVWHTQGSGKSLTMVWLAQKLRLSALGLGNPTVIVMTDRTDLDKQIAATFSRVGFAAPVRASNVKALRSLLRGDASGLTLMTTVQKFQDVTVSESRILNASSNIFVLVDEAHRTQYGPLAAKMRAALPNAVFIAFTGTPIDKKNRSTIKEFGAYIHKYTMEESVRDGATVPILYEARDLEHLGVMGETMDVLFERFFADSSPADREKIKRKYATLEAIGAAPARVREIAANLVKHFESAIAPNGFKGQVVAVNREAAARYKDELDTWGLSSEVVFTGQDKDEAFLTRFHTTKAQQDAIIERFKKEAHPQLLIVVDMLLTGFDAPVEQVLYLDKPLREHALLQAIARVNRVAAGKTEGFVVDYWGVTEHLQDALEIFEPEDLDPSQLMRPKSSELPRLEARRRRALSFFDGRGRDDLEGLLRVIEPEDVRLDFEAAFRAFAQSMNTVYPDPRALEFEPDLQWLGWLRDLARQKFRDDSLDWTGIADKVKTLINQYITASGVTALVGPISIFSPQFDELVARLGSVEAQASEMAHATRHEINLHFDENPVVYESLKQRLEEIIELRHENRLSAAQQLEQLQQIVGDLRGVQSHAQRLGLSDAGFAVYQLLEQREVSAAQGLSAKLERSLRELIVLDWTRKEDVQREMRRVLRRELLTAGVPRVTAEPLLNDILDVAKANFA
jgi:type I restriction enzyme, R subunit